MRISIAPWLSCFAILAATACTDLTLFDAAAEDKRSMALLGGRVTAQGPTGYCVQTQASRPARGFALLALCDDAAGQPDADGLITVQVGADGSALGANQNALAAFLNTEAGRGLLSVSGEPSDIRVQKADMRSGGVTVQFWDQGAPAIVGAQKQEWRGFFDLNGRLTTIAVRGRAAAPLGTDEGQVLLDRAMAAMQQANPDVSG